MAWLYVPGLEDSSLGSGLPFPGSTLFVTSSGKPSPRPYSWPGWRTRPWVRLLSGVISQPSAAESGAASWIALLRGFRASRLAPPESNSGRPMSAGSGRTSSACLGRFNLDGSFSRTSLDLFGTVSKMLPEDWPVSGTMRNGTVSARKQSERNTVAGGSSFSRNEYPTPSATSYGTSQNEGKVPHKRPTAGTPSLETWAKKWEGPGSLPQGQRISRCGETCSPDHRSLNPLFVEWLMGWPIGWTGFEPVGMECIRWKQLMRSALSKLERNG